MYKMRIYFNSESGEVIVDLSNDSDNDNSEEKNEIEADIYI